MSSFRRRVADDVNMHTNLYSLQQHLSLAKARRVCYPAAAVISGGISVDEVHFPGRRMEYYVLTIAVCGGLVVSAKNCQYLR